MTATTTISLGGTSVGLGYLGAVRGDRVEAPGGAVGRFVGRRGVLDCMCYDDERYITLCEAFDLKRS